MVKVSLALITVSLMQGLFYAVNYIPQDEPNI